jgi:hypothetical protein
MRKPSKMVPREELERESRARNLLERALQCAVSEAPVATERYREPKTPGARYTLKLFRPTAADGGIVVSIFEYPGQHPSVRAYRLDDMIGWRGDAFVEEYAAIDRLRQARERAWKEQ